jgi:hypothetical protein
VVNIADVVKIFSEILKLIIDTPWRINFTFRICNGYNIRVVEADA